MSDHTFELPENLSHVIHRHIGAAQFVSSSAALRTTENFVQGCITAYPTDSNVISGCLTQEIVTRTTDQGGATC